MTNKNENRPQFTAVETAYSAASTPETRAAAAARLAASKTKTNHRLAVSNNQLFNAAAIDIRAELDSGRTPTAEMEKRLAVTWDGVAAHAISQYAHTLRHIDLNIVGFLRTRERVLLKWDPSGAPFSIYARAAFENFCKDEVSRARSARVEESTDDEMVMDEISYQQWVGEENLDPQDAPSKTGGLTAIVADLTRLYQDSSSEEALVLREMILITVGIDLAFSDDLDEREELTGAKFTAGALTEQLGVSRPTAQRIAVRVQEKILDIFEQYGASLPGTRGAVNPATGHSSAAYRVAAEKAARAAEIAAQS